MESDNNKTAMKRQRSTHNAAKKGAANSKVAAPQAQPKEGIAKQTLVMVAIAVIFIAVFSSLFYGLVSYKPTSFKTFSSNFAKANSVAIYVNYTNGTDYGPELSCSNALIEELAGSVVNHKNASQINLYILYNDSCIYRQGALGTLISNYTNTTRAACLGYGKSMPSIFINYSTANSTVIKPTQLYFTGDAKFLDECGIAYQIT